MARVVALVPDLMFGSKVHAALEAAGPSVTLCASADAALAASVGGDVLVVDLASGTIDAAALIAGLAPPRPATLACYAHVEPDARAAALAAGFDVVVPRSRLNREGAELVARLLTDG